MSPERYARIDSAVGLHHIRWSEDEVGKTYIHGIGVEPVRTKRKRYQTNDDIERVIGIIKSDKRKQREMSWVFKHCDFSGTTKWQQDIWFYLATAVPAGHVISYGGIAEKLGKPGAARSVGSCMAKNRYPLLIPCHRVVASAGRLGGFMNGKKEGLTIKRNLLLSEGVAYVGNTLKNDGQLIT